MVSGRDNQGEVRGWRVRILWKGRWTSWEERRKWTAEGAVVSGKESPEGWGVQMEVESKCRDLWAECNVIITMVVVSRVGSGGENSEVREQKAGRRGGRAEGRRNHR